MPMGTHAFLAIDPGETTGVAACYVNFTFGTKKEVLSNAKKKKSLEVKGNYLEQGRALGHLMDRFVYVANVENLLSLENVHIVMEDFVLRRRTEGGATGNLTSCWVAAAAVMAYSLHPAQSPEEITALMIPPVEVVWQQPSEAKFVDNVKLKAYGLYEVGSEHKRDAWRHVATRVDKLLP